MSIFSTRLFVFTLFAVAVTCSTPQLGLASDGAICAILSDKAADVVPANNPISSDAILKASQKIPYNKLDLVNRLDQFEALVKTPAFLTVTDTLRDVLLNQDVRLTWGPDTDTKNYRMIEGTVVRYDELTGVSELRLKTGNVITISLRDFSKADIFVKVPSAKSVEQILTDNPAERNPESAGLLAQISNRIRGLSRDLRVRDRIEFWTRWLDRLVSWQLRGERASRISDAFFIADVTSMVRRGGSSTIDATNKVRTLFEGTETATVVLKVFPTEMARLSAELAKDPSNKTMKAQLDSLHFQVKVAEQTLGRNYTRYIWLRGTLAHMAEGKNDCAGGCRDSALRVLEAGGINESLAIRYDTLLKGQPRPSIQDMRVLFDERVSVIMHKLRFETWQEFGSFLRSWIFAKPAWNGLHVAAEKIPHPIAKKWVLQILELLADNRIRFDHLPKINKIKYGHSDAKELAETRVSQLDELRGFSVVDSEILVTMARVIEHEALWAELRDLAKTRYPDFHSQMEKAEAQAKVMGPRSSLYKKSLVTTTSQAVLLIGGGVYGYYQGLFENMHTWLPSLAGLLGF